MDRKEIAKKTAEVTISYLTFQAMRTVQAQLREIYPVKAVWLGQFSTQGKLQNGEAYLDELMAEDREIALRIMTVRQHLAEEIVEFLPEMVSLGIQKANMNRRRQMLERMTQVQNPDEVVHEEEQLSAPVEDSQSDSSPTDSTSDPIPHDPAQDETNSFDADGE
ncbi:MAG: chaperonin family protein RbcX [Cyanobacteria bacterium P01_A01_bin.3]